jgi:hypothetical protein
LRRTMLIVGIRTFVPPHLVVTILPIRVRRE